MNFGLGNPAGLWFLGLIIPILALHVLKPRRVQAAVSSVFLWRKVARPVSAAKPWQRLVPSWLLAAQLLAAILLALAFAKPVQLTDEPLAEHTIFVIDASGSMQSTDGSPDRLADAQEVARDLRRQVPAGGEASLVVASDRARAVLTKSGDVDAFDDALARIEPSPGTVDFAGAFALAAGLDTGDRPSRVVIVSDGGVPDADLRLAPTGSRYERVGETDANRGISQLTVEPADGGLLARVTVRHYGGPEATQTLRVDVDGRTVNRQEVTLDRGGVLNLSVPLPIGERIEAFLESDDVLPLDNRAVATVARRPEITVLWVGADDAFLDALFAVVPGAKIERADVYPDVLPDGVDVVVANKVAIPDPLPAPTWAITPTSSAAAIETTGEAERPALTLVRADRPLLTGLDLSEVLLARAQKVTVPPEAEVLLGAEGVPLLTVVETPGGTLVHQAFTLGESNLPLQAAFPVLGQRILGDLASTITPPARVNLGSDLPFDPRLDAVITAPDGTSFEISPGSAVPSATQIGFWEIRQPGRVPVLVAANASVAESNIAPAIELPLESAVADGSQPEVTQGQIPWVWPVILILLLVLAAEWYLAQRRLGVGPRQWKVATGMRVMVALALLATLFNPGWSRSTNEVGAVFLIDSSDSLGPAGRAAAVAYVRDALRERPDGDLGGVVSFGRDARLETLVDDDPDFGGLTVRVDATGTDLAAALRLGAAAAPGDSRKRLILISDGRATTGDVIDEAERLKADGIPVDVVIIDPPRGTDLAVAGIDVPPVARNGEAVEVTVRVSSPAETTARIELRREGTVIGSQDVALQPGENPVTFIDTADGTGVLRYDVEVTGLADAVTANNLGYAAVPVSGAEKVLVVDGGGSADARDFASALVASGLPVDITPVDRVGGVDDLTQYASIVLVNVDARDLGDVQTTALTAAVRDLGRGLLVVGGSHTYALGGYRDSQLEEILPVVSEILDPLRRQTVAEVLAIDTSGSMGACHCAEEPVNGLDGGNRFDGGVNKTDIAKNATARAIAALGSTDEVGVLSINNRDRWVIDLQPRPSQEVINDGLSQLEPDGPTEVQNSLRTAAEELRKSEANLKHIIFFSDGFTEPRNLAQLADDAADLREEGITVSVVATGEGAAVELERIADAGGGRFYPGRDLSEIPDLIVQEAVLASRDFVNEGDFLPIITSNSATVRNLSSSPPLSGYIATTAKPTARVDLRIGPDEDPLLASWQIGLGRVSTWASDSGERWGSAWNAWDSSPDFWAAVVKDTFPTAGDGGGVIASIDGDQLSLRIEGVDDWADDATATVRVSGPDGEGTDVVLERLDGSTFAAVVSVEEAGTYAIGGAVSSDDETVWSGIGLTTRSYPAEYAPTPLGDDLMTRLANLTGGRTDPLAVEVFDPTNTVAGSSRIDLAKWLLLLSLLLWPIAVAVSRLAWKQGVLAVGANRASSTVRQLQERVPKMGTPKLPTDPSAPSGPTPPREPIIAAPSKPAARPSAAPSASRPAPPTAPKKRGGPPAPPSAPRPVGADESSLEQLLANKRNKNP